MYKTWYNYHKDKYVKVYRIDIVDKHYVQIMDEDGDWYTIKKSELR